MVLFSRMFFRTQNDEEFQKTKSWRDFSTFTAFWEDKAQKKFNIVSPLSLFAQHKWILFIAEQLWGNHKCPEWGKYSCEDFCWSCICKIIESSIEREWHRLVSEFWRPETLKEEHLKWTNRNINIKDLIHMKSQEWSPKNLWFSGFQELMGGNVFIMQ